MIQTPNNLDMTEKEIKKLRSIVKEYSYIDKKMRKNEELLKKISTEQTKLMERLEKNESKEKNFMESISKKYHGISLEDIVEYI